MLDVADSFSHFEVTRNGEYVAVKFCFQLIASEP